MELKEQMYFGEKKRYRLIRKLGSGGFSEVWLAEDTKADDMKVALKVYASAGGLDEEGVQMFSNEFSLLFNMNHSNLLKPTHFDDYESRPFLAIPFCKNGSAQKLVGNISEADAWRFLRDVASGLAYLHSLNPPVIHQDISTENVLIDEQGDFLITDFGISTKTRITLHKNAVNLKNSQEGGKVDFMAPELFGTKNEPIKAGDIWAFGVTMYELLEGRLPFPQGLGGLAQKGGADIPEISKDYSKELKNIVYKMLAKEPWDRPTAETIKEQTEIRLGGGNRKKRRKPWITIVMTIGFIAILAGGGIWYLQHEKTVRQEQQRIEEQNRIEEQKRNMLNGKVEKMKVWVYERSVYLQPTTGELDKTVYYTSPNGLRIETAKSLPANQNFIYSYTYSGQMKDGFPNDGEAIYDKDESVYKGQLNKGFRHGKGKYIFPNGVIYEGEYENGGKKRGKEIFVDGSYYDGSFKDDKPDGYGVYTDQDGKETKGIFENGKIKEHR